MRLHPTTGQSAIVIDEAWLAEWINYGFAEMDAYLAKHAAFDAYYHRHREAAA